MATMRDLAVATENRRAAVRHNRLTELARMAADRAEYAAACELSALARSGR